MAGSSPFLHPWSLVYVTDLSLSPRALPTGHATRLHEGKEETVAPAFISVTLRPLCYTQHWTMTKPQAADPLFFPMSSPRPQPPFASVASPPVSDPVLLGAAGVGSAGGAGRAGQLQQAASHPLPLLSSGAMRCHVASSCLAVWLSVLISGCWGKSNPLPSPPTAGMGGWARRHVVGVFVLWDSRDQPCCV